MGGMGGRVLWEASEAVTCRVAHRVGLGAKSSGFGTALVCRVSVLAGGRGRRTTTRERSEKDGERGPEGPFLRTL